MVYFNHRETFIHGVLLSQLKYVEVESRGGGDHGGGQIVAMYVKLYGSYIM